MLNLGIIGTSWITDQFIAAAFSTREEMDKIITLANKQRVFFFEAARNIHEQSFAEVKKFLESSRQVQGASFHYAKYSSRMDRVLAGEEPNIFSLKFSGGALYDLGVYQIYAAIGWFGMPKSVHYFASLVPTGVDALGTGILRYENFDVTIQPGKSVTSYAPSEIFLANGTLVLAAISAINSADYYERKKDVRSLKVNALTNPMKEEAEDFAQVLLLPKNADWGAKYEEWIELARNVNAVLVAMREDAGIIFTADGKS
ncbi:MAG: gfo/Idh/MocA family oxidoreductase [Streptococcaceae bacterium]|jgi:predicted dehydrogenase|nr:gfo/Idh/MocA family oxidoreductase [Streptococcaceae bacterium]